MVTVIPGLSKPNPGLELANAFSVTGWAGINRSFGVLVKSSFTQADGCSLEDFLPYQDGFTLYIERKGKNSGFRLQWRAETQAHIIDNFPTSRRSYKLDPQLSGSPMRCNRS